MLQSLASDTATQAAQMATAARMQTWSAVVQAGAAVIALSVTIVLARLTARYVALTRELVDSSRAQLDLIKEQQATRRTQSIQSMRAVASRLLNTIGNLNKTAPSFDELRRLDINPTDMLQLEAFARELGPIAISEAGIAVYGLHRMAALAEQVKEINPAMGWNPNQKESEMWQATLPESIRALAAVFDEINAAKLD